MVRIINETNKKIDDKLLSITVQGVLDALKKSDESVSVIFISAEKSQELNKEHRHKDRPTNVLSFPNQEVPGFITPEKDESLGQIFLCMDVIESEAGKLSYPLNEWLTRLLIHGILHLSGYTHGESTDTEKMEKKEEEIFHSLSRSE